MERIAQGLGIEAQAELTRLRAALARETLAARLDAEKIIRLESALAQAEQVIAQDDARLRAAELRVWGDMTYGCDGPDQLADAVLAARAALRQAEAERDDARREAAALLARISGAL